MKSKALQLAGELEVRGFLGTTAHDAATELRRLHAVNTDLLKVLKAMMAFAPDATCEIMHELHTRCRDAIAKTE